MAALISATYPRVLSRSFAMCLCAADAARRLVGLTEAARAIRRVGQQEVDVHRQRLGLVAGAVQAGHGVPSQGPNVAGLGDGLGHLHHLVALGGVALPVAGTDGQRVGQRRLQGRYVRLGEAQSLHVAIEPGHQLGQRRLVVSAQLAGLVVGHVDALGQVVVHVDPMDQDLAPAGVLGLGLGQLTERHQGVVARQNLVRSARVGADVAGDRLVLGVAAKAGHDRGDVTLARVLVEVVELRRGNRGGLPGGGCVDRSHGREDTRPVDNTE